MRKPFKLLPWLLCGLLLAGCSSGPRISDDYTARDQDSRVQYIVLHYTAADSKQSLKLLTQAGSIPTAPFIVWWTRIAAPGMPA